VVVPFFPSLGETCVSVFVFCSIDRISLFSGLRSVVAGFESFKDYFYMFDFC
jgi:hypothetical protein